MSVTSYITGPARRIALGSTVALIAIGVVACSSTTTPAPPAPHRRASPCRIWSGSIGSTPNRIWIHWAGRVSSSKGLTSRQIRNSGTGSLSRVRRPVSTWTPTAQSHSNSVCETSLPPVVGGAPGAWHSSPMGAMTASVFGSTHVAWSSMICGTRMRRPAIGHCTNS